MKKSFVLSLIPCFMLCLSAHADNDCAKRKDVPDTPQTLQQIIELGICRNPNTSAAYLAAESTRLNKNTGYASYLPKVDATASVTSQYRRENWTDPAKGASLSASWLIFDFGKRYADLGALSAVWRATGFDYNNATQNYVYEIIAAYYGMLTTDAEVKVATDLVTVARGAQDIASKKFSAGAVARADVLKADTTLAMRELELQRATGNRQIAKGRLLYLLSFSQEQELQITDMPTNFGSETESKAVAELIETAKRQRPDLLSSAESTNAAWHRRNAAFLRNLPSISATGSLTYDLSDNYDQFGMNPNDKWGGTIGIRASMPIFAGFANTYNARSQQAAYERAKEQQRAKEDSVSMDIWTAYQNYQTAQKVLEQANVLLKSAIESEKVVAGMYRVGRATMLDWQTQQADLASAQRQNISARYDLYVKRAALALAMGELQEELANAETNIETL
ncbi:MAG: TolC family protein [Alphaproteobacteria bacterium]|nr:TolC family protein [Alphaproteobacteria bacterium]